MDWQLTMRDLFGDTIALGKDSDDVDRVVMSATHLRKTQKASGMMQAFVFTCCLQYANAKGSLNINPKWFLWLRFVT